MELVVLIIHLLVCICLIGLVLLQRSEGGALGMGGGGGGALMSGRGAADALAKMTSVAGGFFLVTSLGLTVLSGSAASSDRNILDNLDFGRAPITAPAAAPAQPAPAQPETTTPDPTESSAPQAAETRLAAVMPGPSAAAATPLPSNTTRAAPLAPSTTGGATPASASRNNTVAASTTARNNAAPANTTARNAPPAPARNGAATTPAAATQATRTAPAPTPTRSGGAANQTAAGQAPAQALVLPNTSGAVTGITLSDDPSQTESIQIGNGNVEAVRRERAGPDQ